MTTSVLDYYTETANHFDEIVIAIGEQGYIVLDNVFDVDDLNSLFVDIKSRSKTEFHNAGIGRDDEHQVNQFIRRDRICWVDQQAPQIAFYLQWMEQLRLSLNSRLYLGLFDYECLYAHYPRAAFYKKHLDAFRGSSNRRLTAILYLNPTWRSRDGGELLLYQPDSDQVIQRIEPIFGRMVIFLSEQFPHEVLLAKKSRYSITGWFRINE